MPHPTNLSAATFSIMPVVTTPERDILLLFQMPDKSTAGLAIGKLRFIVS